jgi:hypothetical protein
MNRAALESLDKETLVTLVLAQAESIVALTRQVGILTARVAEFEARLGFYRRRRRTIPARRPRSRPSLRAGRPARNGASRIRARTSRCIPIRHRGAM